jgi:hypothetical protein
VTKLKTELQGLSSVSTVSELIDSVATMGSEVSATVADTRDTFNSLEQSNSELKSGWSSVDSCKQLKEDLGQ